MNNFIQPGNTITLTAPAAVSSGDGVQVGQIFGVATTDAANGAEVEVQRIGVFSIPKAAEAISEGDLLYWDNANSVLTKTSAAGLILVGYAIKAALLGDVRVTALLDGAARPDQAA